MCKTYILWLDLQNRSCKQTPSFPEFDQCRVKIFFYCRNMLDSDKTTADGINIRLALVETSNNVLILQIDVL